jgi:hypothetical protein
VRLLAVSMVLLPGCYLATRVGPSYTTANGVLLDKGNIDWQVTAGVEATWPTHDASRLFDPFSGRAHLSMGGGGGESSSGEIPSSLSAAASSPPSGSGSVVDPMPTVKSSDASHLSNGVATMDLRYTLAKTGSDGTGAWVDAKATMGIGGGSMEISDGTTLHSAEAGVLMEGAGIEAGVHEGGNEAYGLGFVLGVGVNQTNYGSALGDAKSVSPYVSAKIEGVLLFYAVLAMCEAMGRR